MKIRHVFIEGRSLGERSAPRQRSIPDAEAGYLQMSFIYISPQTGKAWATLPALEGDKVSPFVPLSVPGPGEQSRSGFPAGSLLSVSLSLLDQLPPKAIEREFFLHLNHLSQGVSHESNQASHP